MYFFAMEFDCGTLSNPSVIGEAIRQKNPELRSRPAGARNVTHDPGRYRLLVAQAHFCRSHRADRDLRPCPSGDGNLGITSYATAQRKKEMAIRMTFGADRTDVFSLVLKETCRLALAGSVLGCTAAAIVARAATNISSLSPEMASTQARDALDPVAFVLSCLLLFAVAGAATYAPARRALRTDPADTLLHEWNAGRDQQPAHLGWRTKNTRTLSEFSVSLLLECQGGRIARDQSEVNRARSKLPGFKVVAISENDNPVEGQAGFRAVQSTNSSIASQYPRCAFRLFA